MPLLQNPHKNYQSDRCPPSKILLPLDQSALQTMINDNTKLRSKFCLQPKYIDINALYKKQLKKIGRHRYR